MTHVKAISAQHFKSTRAIILTTKGRPSLPKEVRRMAWWWTKWPIKQQKDPTPNNFSNITMLQISNLP